MLSIKQKIINWLNKKDPSSRGQLCDFDTLQHEIKPGDVLLIDGTTRVSKIIQYLTQSSWSHSVLYLGRAMDFDDKKLFKIIEEQIDISYNPHLIIESQLDKGTIISYLKTYKGEHLRICRPKGLTYADTQKAIQFALSHVGTSYNVRQIIDLIRFFLPWRILPKRWGSTLFRPHNEDHKDICSTLIAEAFASVKFPILPEIKSDSDQPIEIIPHNPNTFTPNDFDYSPYFEIIKYPMLNVATPPSYRNLPWTDKNIVSDGKGQYSPHKKNEPN